jgi:hypothetical protein
MSKQTTKPLSQKDGNQVLQGIYNESGTVSVDGFVSSKVGAKVTRTVISSTIDDYRYFDVYDEQVVSVSSGSATVQFIEDLPQTLEIGQYLFGTDIAANTTILSFNRELKTVTMSANATGTDATEDLKIANLLVRLRLEFNNANHDEINDVERLD